MFRFSLLQFLLVFGSVPISANSSVADTQQVAAAVAALNAALIDADRRTLEELTAAELTYGHSSGKIQDRTAFLAEVASNAFDFVSIRTAEQTITVIESLAVVRHVFAANFITNGAPGELKIGNLLVWQLHEGKWKLVARQAYKL